MSSFPHCPPPPLIGCPACGTNYRLIVTDPCSSTKGFVLIVVLIVLRLFKLDVAPQKQEDMDVRADYTEYFPEVHTFLTDATCGLINTNGGWVK